MDRAPNSQARWTQGDHQGGAPEALSLDNKAEAGSPTREVGEGTGWGSWKVGGCRECLALVLGGGVHLGPGKVQQSSSASPGPVPSSQHPAPSRGSGQPDKDKVPSRSRLMANFTSNWVVGAYIQTNKLRLEQGNVWASGSDHHSDEAP